MKEIQMHGIWRWNGTMSRWKMRIKNFGPFWRIRWSSFLNFQCACPLASWSVYSNINLFGKDMVASILSKTNGFALSDPWLVQASGKKTCPFCGDSSAPDSFVRVLGIAVYFDFRHCWDCIYSSVYMIYQLQSYSYIDIDSCREVF